MDPDPAFHCNADPDPSFQLKARNLENVLKWAHIPYGTCWLFICKLMRIRIQLSHFDADADLAYHFDADPDPTFQFAADPDSNISKCTAFAGLRIRIHFIRIRIQHLNFFGSKIVLRPP